MGWIRGLTAALVVLVPLVASAAEPIVVLTSSSRREVPTVARSGAEMVAIEPLLAGFGVTMTPDPRKNTLTLSSGGRQVVLYDGRNLASVGGELRLLTAASVRDGRGWMVPVDSLPRLMGPLLGLQVEWRAPARTLVVGEVDLPRVTLRTSVSGEAARVELDAGRPLPFRVTQEAGRVLVAIPEGAIDFAFQQETITGGIVESVRVLGGRENVVEVKTGPRFEKVDAVEDGSRLVLEFRATAAAPTASSASPSPVPPGAPAYPSSRQPTIVIDPGHGGEDLGAQGPSGTMEKEVALSVARRLRALLANTGVHVFLTRDRDQSMSLDERTAIANNYKADVFVSIHANASRAQSARGSEVYFLSADATDDDSRRLAMLESQDAPGTAPVAPTSDLAMILWDMAQAAHLAESSVLATRVQENLAEVTGSEGRGVKQAPFRVLVGAAMPAVLVELAFISNSAEEKLLASDAYQSRVAAALARGITSFIHERDGAGGTRASR